MINIRGLLTAGLDSFGRVSSERWNLLVRAVRELQDSKGTGGVSEINTENFMGLLKRYGADLFLSKQHEDETSYLLKLLAGAIIDKFLKSSNFLKSSENGYNDGQGFGIWEDNDKDWHIELDYANIRRLARLAELYVVGDSTFGGSLASIEFISSFLGGKGWSIQKKTRINAAGVEEEYYTLEIDSVTVRETLRVYEMVISQLRGEYDNYVFAAMMEVHHYDPQTGKVWLTTECEKIKAVCFKQGDYIRVQQYLPGNDVVSGGDGYITKFYELIITDAGTGGQTDENGDRLDWVTFKNFTTSMENGTPATVIEKKDTFVRIDNETDIERKGLMQIITVGPNTPYQDVYYGMKTDPNDALKMRLGNLSGIRTDLFGWLEGFGTYMPNLYGVGKMFNRQTGESFNSSIEITRERLKSVYSEVTYNISDEDNFLTNGFFARGLESWEVCTVNGGAAPSETTQETINSGDGTPLMVNGAILAYQNRLTAKMTDYDGMKVLHLLGMGICQSFADIKANETHKENMTDNDQNENYTKTKDVYDRLYLGVRMLPISTGTLTVTFLKSNGSQIAQCSQEINASREWVIVEFEDTEANPWQYTGETGRMIVSYTGDCYVRFIALRTNPIANSRETYSTLIEQTSRRITLQAAKQTADLNQAIAEINIEFDNIRTTVTNNKTAADTAFGTLRDRATSLEGRASGLEKRAKDLEDAVDDLEDDSNYYGTWIYQTDRTINLWAAQFDSSGQIKKFSAIEQSIDDITLSVQAIEGDYVTSAEMGVFIDDWGTSHASIKADKIDFTFSEEVSFYAKNGNTITEVMNIRPNGDLWIKGDLLGGNIKGNYTIGSTGNKMQIYCDETIVGDWKASGIRGLDTDGYTVLNLGFSEMNGSTSPFLSLKGKQAFTQHEVQILIRPDTLAFLPIVGNKPPITFGYALGSNKLYLSTWLEAWPTRDEVGVGQVFLGDDEILRVRRG